MAEALQRLVRPGEGRRLPLPVNDVVGELKGLSVCMYECMHVRMYMYIDASMYAYMYLYIYVYMYTCVQGPPTRPTSGPSRPSGSSPCPSAGAGTRSTNPPRRGRLGENCHHEKVNDAQIIFLPAAGCWWLLLATAACCWLLLTAAGCWGTWAGDEDLVTFAELLIQKLGECAEVLFRFWHIY